MKKLLLLATAVLTSGMLKAQYPYYTDFDAMTSGAAPTGGWATPVNGFKVMSGHGWSAPNACSTEMNSTHTTDSLVTPSIGPVTANTKLSLSYRFVDAALYPSTGTTLTSGDKVTVDAYIAGNWQPNVATIDNTVHSAPLTTYTTYTYTNAACAIIAGQSIKLRLNVFRAAGDWFLDIDNFIVADAITGISYNAFNPPAIAVSPNPSNGNFWIWLKNYTSNNTVQVKLYNHMGQVVKSITADNVVNNQFNVNTTDLAKGVYFVEVRSGNDVSKTKIVVE